LIADEASLARLAGLAQRGDKQAYAALLGAARHWLARYFRTKTLPHGVEGLVREPWLWLLRKLGSYDPERPFMPWLAAIARYRFVDHLRLVYRQAEDELDADQPALDSDEPAITARISLERLFEVLPEAQQRAIELVKIEGLSISEASAYCGQSESLIKVNIHRGLKRLAALVERA